MAWRSGTCVLVGMLIVGCSSTRRLSDVEFQAQRHMAIADTLERAAALAEATLEYTLVADRFPATSVHAAAVRKAALLYSSPINPIANDSVSRYWLTRYLDLAESPEEKQIIQMYLKIVDRVTSLRDSLARHTALSDSLAVVARKQTGEASSRGKRIQELESELEKASSELKKLKEIDVRISKSRGKNKP